jgi:quinol-cytochrome oxidoreductase complex cytochrome b subunit
VKVLKNIYYWIDERVEMHDYIKKDVLDKPIPKGLNLSYCFGGITFFLFVMLAATGYFMTIYYVPSPDQAYDTVDYITYEVSMGDIVRGVHHWSANLMFVTIFIHMIRVFIYGAYKKPREINWITGVLLLSLVMAFGFTGYLLPWDQRAYWATKVGTSIMGTVPLIGEYVLKITRGGTKLGALTLVRFYSLHVIFLPLATGCLLIGHFMMIRRQGISDPLFEDGKRKTL